MMWTCLVQFGASGDSVQGQHADQAAVRRPQGQWARPHDGLLLPLKGDPPPPMPPACVMYVVLKLTCESKYVNHCLLHLPSHRCSAIHSSLPSAFTHMLSHCWNAVVLLMLAILYASTMHR